MNSFPEFVPEMAVAAAVMVVTWLCWTVIDWAWLKPKALERRLRKEGLSGNPYRVLYGDMKDFSKLRKEARSKPIPFTNSILPRVMPQLYHSLFKHGKNSFVWMGPRPMVYITRPELIREVFTRMNVFGKPKLNPVMRLLIPGLIMYEGEKWVKHRKMMNPAFQVEKLKLLLPKFYSSCVEMVDAWEMMLHETGSIELDAWPYLVKLASDVISKAAFGSSFEEGMRIFELLTMQAELIMQIIQKPYIPGLRFIPTKANRRMKKLNVEIKTLIVGIIEKRKKEMEYGEDKTEEDLLGMLMKNAFHLEMHNGNDQKKQHVGITIGELIDECKFFYIGGQETTAVLLVWTIIMLGKHQDWQRQAREEVLIAFGKSKPNFDGLNQLKKVTMILFEVLRLYPPIVEINRRTKHDVELGNIRLPAGVIVNMPIMFIHQDPELWGNDASEFRPDRFSEGIVKATGGNNAFFPFGWGPTICIGQNFSLIKAKLALTMILQRFSFEISPSYTHAPSTLMTLQPQFGAQIVLQKV